MQIFAVLLVLVSLVAAQNGCGQCTGAQWGICECPPYGTVRAGHPNWQERAQLMWMNVARQAPAQFKIDYMPPFTTQGAFLGGMYPRQPPLYWQYDLNRVARAHGRDMALNCGLQHNSCNGTGFGTRVRSYYGAGGALGENAFDIPGGTSQYFHIPRHSIRAYLCEGPISLGGDWQGPQGCYPDGVNDGHRANIMSATFVHVGVGAFPVNGGFGGDEGQVHDFGGSGNASLGLLEFAETEVSDLSVLPSISALQFLDISGTLVSELPEGASVRSLYASGTQISDLSPLMTWPAPDVWYVGSNQVSDLSPLLDFNWDQADCAFISISGNPLTESLEMNQAVVTQLCEAASLVISSEKNYFSCRAEGCTDD